MAKVSKRGNFYIIKDNGSEYTVDERNGAITEKSRPNITKADCKIVMVATSKTSPDLKAKIMHRYFSLFN